MEQSTIKKINVRHIWNVDKLYRKFGGLASELLQYSNGCMYLKITRYPRWKKEDELTAEQIALNWKWEEAHGFDSKLYNGTDPSDIYVLTIAKSKSHLCTKWDCCSDFSIYITVTN